MKNQNINIVKHEDEQISETQLLSEIFPLIEEYFVGNFLFDGQQIAYILPNGQTFLITAKTM